MCVTANEIPSIEDTGIVPHYLPGENPEADFMTRMFNLPKEAAMGYAETLYPEYRKTIKSTYRPPAECSSADRGIAADGSSGRLPGGAPNLTCNDGGFGNLGPRGRSATSSSSQ